jgi:hypothetical protein
LVERGLDFCRATRTLVSEAQTLNVHYVFISDLYRSYLYDSLTDELLLHADTPLEFANEFAPVLGRESMERGALEELRRQPRSCMATQLRDWCSYWMTQYEKATGLNEIRAAAIIDRLLVTRYLFAKDILRRTKWRLEQRFLQLLDRASSHRPEGVGRELNRLFRDMGEDWGIELFANDPYIDDAVANDVLTAAMLTEFGLMSRTRFSISTVLESFNHGEPAEKMRVRMVPTGNEERDRPGACSDKLAYACDHGIRVYYETPLQFRIARLMLTLHLVSRYHQLRQPVDRLPSLDAVLQVRPNIHIANPLLDDKPIREVEPPVLRQNVG